MCVSLKLCPERVSAGSNKLSPFNRQANDTTNCSELLAQGVPPPVFAGGMKAHQKVQAVVSAPGLEAV